MYKPHPSPDRSRKQATFLSRVPVHCITPFCSETLVSSPNLYPPWINHYTAETNYTIDWIEIYPVDSAIQPLNNRGQNIYLFTPYSFLSRVLWCCINDCLKNHTAIRSRNSTTDLIAPMVAGIFPRLVSATRVFFVF